MLFDSIGIAELLVLAVLALIVFGPERLPEAAKKAANMMRQLRRMANNAQNDLSQELGPEFRDLELNDLRNPRRAVQKYVLDDLHEDDVRIDKDLDLRKDLNELDRRSRGDRERQPARTRRTSDEADRSAASEASDLPDTTRSVSAGVEGTDHVPTGAPRRNGSGGVLPEGELPPFDPEAT